MEIIERIEKEGLVYTHYASGFHEFVFTGEGEAGLDHFFEIIKGLLSGTSGDQIIRYVVDATNTRGQGAMGELVRRFRKLEVQLGDRAAGRTAILHNGSLLLTLANTFIDTLAPDKDKTRFFDIKERDKAIQWLLSEK